VVGGAVIAPSFIDWNARLPEIAAQVKDATGRDLTIDGKLEVRILPAPMVTARGVKLGNIQGGKAAHMVALDAVEVRVALMPMLSGQVQVERVRLVKPVITIEKLADGRTNLDFQTATETPVSSSSAPGGSAEPSAGGGLNVRLDNFEIKNATLIYLDGQTGREERVSDVDATLRATSLQGPFEATGQARARGVPLAFEVSLGQIIAERTVPINASISAPGGTRMQVSGAVLGLGDEPRFKGKVKVAGDNLAQLLNTVAGSKASPTVLARNFALDSVVNASAKSVSLPELEVQFATTRIIGAVDLDMAADTTFDVKLKAARIDVDDLLGAQPAKALSTP
ncbi:MAG: AsmA family protein, partial [Sphingomonadales bacterium]|nr:AsmA family protein [Sphingomonadales bacterium]